MDRIWIGTSGWHYKHWVGTFYPVRTPASRMLDFYTKHFDTVELNNSFYKLPAKTSLAAWRDSTPPDFCFAVKGSRFLTHMKKLSNAEDGLRRFLDAVEVLEPKLGPILFQLPPHWEVNAGRLEDFLKLLPRGRRCAFEFRNATWNTREIYDVLRAYNAAFCVYHLEGFLSPIEVTADFAYVRLHGPGGKYQGSYSDAVLREWTGRIWAWAERLKSVYFYFDNDDSGFAAMNAETLKKMVDPLSCRPLSAPSYPADE